MNTTTQTDETKEQQRFQPVSYPTHVRARPARLGSLSTRVAQMIISWRLPPDLQDMVENHAFFRELANTSAEHKLNRHAAL